MRRRWTRGGSCRRSPRAISAAARRLRDWRRARVPPRQPGRGLSYARAAARAIELGGTLRRPRAAGRHQRASRRRAATALAGLGLMGVAKDTYPRDGTTYSFVAGFAEVEVDVETGKVTLIDYLGVADVGHGHQPAQPRRASRRRVLPRDRPRALSEVGLRPAVRPAARQAVPSQQAAHDPRHSGDAAVGRGRPARSRNAGRRARHRRAAGGRGLRRRDERDRRRGRRRRLPPIAGDTRHRADVARARPPDARAVAGALMTSWVIWSLSQSNWRWS